MHQLKQHPDILDRLWQFARGDLAADAFEAWLYSNQNVEAALGADHYLEAISEDYRDSRNVIGLRSWLKEILPPLADCPCHTVADWGLVELGDWTSECFEFSEGDSTWPYWLRRAKCMRCKTRWTIADDSRIYDTWIVVRGADADMAAVTSYRGLLSVAARLGASVSYVDPWVSVELSAAIEDLAKETPGISLTELAELLPVDREVVHHHAQDVSQSAGVSIDFEKQGLSRPTE